MSIHALNLIKDQLLEQEQQAALVFSQAQQAMTNYQQQLQSLQEYRQTYLDQALQAGIEGISAQDLRHYQQFVVRLDEAAEQQCELLEKMRKEIAEKRQQWQTVQAKRKAIELLLAKKAKAQAILEARTEQKHLDQYALYAHLRTKNSLM